MNRNDFFEPEDHFDMEIPDADSTSNLILLGCLCALCLFAVVGIGACILVATGALQFT